VEDSDGTLLDDGENDEGDLDPDNEEGDFDSEPDAPEESKDEDGPKLLKSGPKELAAFHEEEVGKEQKKRGRPKMSVVAHAF
jgi:hypothetical protein